MTVTESPNGWAVESDGVLIADGFKSNSAAWRWIDRQQGEPISRQENVAEWIWSKIVAGSGTQ